MAADFATPQPAAFKHVAYKASAHFTPIVSGLTPDVSPSSPRSTHIALNRFVPTIEPRRAVPYVPAALRRTEKPVRQSPPKIDSAVVTPGNSWGSGVAASGDGAASPISRIMTEDLNTIYNDTPLSPITGPITRNHWKPDHSTAVCTASACQTTFTFFTRRHHCRKCGGVFCAQHSQRLVRLNEHAMFHPDGEEHRACDRCESQFREWEQLRLSRHNSESSSPARSAIDTPAPPKRPEVQRYGSLATSVHGAWNWSTF